MRKKFRRLCLLQCEWKFWSLRLLYRFVRANFPSRLWDRATHSNWTPKATWNRWAANIKRMDKIFLPNETNAKTHRRQTFFRAFWCHFSLHRSICAHLKKFWAHICQAIWRRDNIFALRNFDNGVRRTSASDGYLKWTSNLWQVYDLSLHIRWTGGLHDFGFVHSKVRRDHSTRKLNAMMLFRGVSFSKKSLI